MTVIVVATFEPATGCRDELLAVLGSRIAEVHEEEGCELYAIHGASDGSIVMIEKWATEAHLTAHSDGPVVERMRSETHPLLLGPAHVVTMLPIPAGSIRQGLL